MGTNVALDIDDRPMPRGPIFPRCVPSNRRSKTLSLTVDSYFPGGVDDARDVPSPRVLVRVRVGGA